MICAMLSPKAMSRLLSFLVDDDGLTNGSGTSLGPLPAHPSKAPHHLSFAVCPDACRVAGGLACGTDENGSGNHDRSVLKVAECRVAARCALASGSIPCIQALPAGGREPCLRYGRNGGGIHDRSVLKVAERRVASRPALAAGSIPCIQALLAGPRRTSAERRGSRATSSDASPSRT